MISIAEALRIIEAGMPPRRLVSIALGNALGMVLAEDVIAPEPSPRFTNSAMDGFAVRGSDIAVDTDVAIALRIVGESQAGSPCLVSVNPGETMRISTGAMLPDGADTVVPVEMTSLEEGRAVFRGKAILKGSHIRYRGEEFEPGDLLLSRGTIINPPEIALLAAVGITEATVVQKPSVGLVTTGSELVSHDGPVMTCQIRNSNSIMLASAVGLSGAMVTVTETVSDDSACTTAALHTCLASACQLILCSGGVSMGKHDHVRQAAAAAGFTPLFWQVAQKPGKPLFLAKKDYTLLFGLPGNPVSALMAYIFYVHPLVVRLTGRDFHWPQRKVCLERPIVNSRDRAMFLRVSLEETPEKPISARILAQQGSHMLTSMTKAQGFVLVGAGETIPVDRGVDVFLFPWV